MLFRSLDWFYHHYFRVQTSGWEHVQPQGQTLFVGSHNGGLATPDLFMFFYDWVQRFGLERPVYGLTHAKIWQVYPLLGNIAAELGAVPFYPRTALTLLEKGHSLLVYPGGAQDVFRPHSQRDRIHLNDRTGFLRLALWHSLPITPLISWGAHDTLFVLANLYPQMRQLHEQGMPWLLGIDPEVFPIYLGLPWGLAIGPLLNIPLPAQIHTRVCPPIVFERSGYAASRDRAYVQACYEQVVSTMQAALDDLIQSVEGQEQPPNPHR